MPTATMVLPAKSGVKTGTAWERGCDESEYLLSSRANREHLNKAVNNIERGENLISFGDIGDAMLYAEKYAAGRLAAT